MLSNFFNINCSFFEYIYVFSYLDLISVLVFIYFQLIISVVSIH